MIWLPYALLFLIWLVAVVIVCVDAWRTAEDEDAERPEIEALMRKGGDGLP